MKHLRATGDLRGASRGSPGSLLGGLQRFPGRPPGPSGGLLQAIGAFRHIRRLPDAARNPPNGPPETIPAPTLGGLNVTKKTPNMHRRNVREKYNIRHSTLLNSNRFADPADPFPGPTVRATDSLIPSLHSLTHAGTHSLNSRTHSRTHTLSSHRSRTHSLTHLPAHSLTQSLIYAGLR